MSAPEDVANFSVQGDLENSVPSSTTSAAAPGSQPGALDPTRAHARVLRAHLEKLDDMSRSRGELAARVDRLAAADDITPRILKAAAGMEQWVNVQPAMFEDILDAELAKFERFRSQLKEDEKKQEELLKAVRVRSFLSPGVPSIVLPVFRTGLD